MPAKSKKQQRFMGMVHAHQKGELPNASPEVKSVATSMNPSDTTDFATTKHTDLPEKVDSKEKVAGDHLAKFLREVCLNPALPKHDSVPGDLSILSDCMSKQAGISKRGDKAGGVNMLRNGSQASSDGCPTHHDVSQPIDITRVKAAGLVREFFPFKLTSPPSWKKRHKESMVMGSQGSQSAAVPLASAQATMQQFLPAAQGKPQLAGLGVPQVGLPAGGVKAPAFPGAGNSPASNPIDVNGGLDPTGLTVDGNHARGVPKGFKMAEWLADKAVARGLREVTAQLYPDLDSEGVMGLLTSLNCRSGRDGSQLLSQLRAKAACCETDDSALFVSRTLWNASQLRSKLCSHRP